MVNFDFSARPQYYERFVGEHQFDTFAGNAIDTARKKLQHEDYKKFILQLSHKKTELMNRRHLMDTGDLPNEASTKTKTKTSSRLQN